jgi:hypothetical protein
VLRVSLPNQRTTCQSYLVDRQLPAALPAGGTLEHPWQIFAQAIYQRPLYHKTGAHQPDVSTSIGGRPSGERFSAFARSRPPGLGSRDEKGHELPGARPLSFPSLRAEQCGTVPLLKHDPYPVLPDSRGRQCVQVRSNENALAHCGRVAGSFIP